ncbi:right-handed parallel beta-helix repeat-containing protein [Archangium lansingense]|uniref:Right-handed parallel beta-helix repeat-containing protein n=1 Tax=Archangium lansingense TaxID=2995310 RepID=A0ABT3ZY05_9BACT|nr:right-handed parallel beta-helix repeat-containing protein [Archangium lansinium]MCY1074280.1 right-handed parallel beta-helix repeat-containing protein [Archangium lansinium]
MMKLLKSTASAAALGVSLLGAVVASTAAHGTAAVDGGVSVAVPAVLADNLAPFDPAMAQAPTIEPNPKNVDYPVPTVGSVYFVSTTGNDAADGRSKTTPFKTLGRALTVARAGPRPATVVLRAGTYEEGAAAAGPSGAYTIDFPVTIQPHRGEKVWMKGSVMVTGWSSVGTNRWRRTGWTTRFCQRPTDGGSDPFCKHPSLNNPTYPMAGAQDMVFRNDQPLRQVRTLAEVGPGRFFVDTALGHLYIGDSPTGARIEASNRDLALHVSGFGPGTGGSGTVIQGLGFKHYASEQQTAKQSTERPPKGGVVLLDNVSNTRVENNTITRSASTALTAVKATRAVIRDNLLAENGFVGANITGTAGGLTFDGNRVFRNNTEGLHDTLTGGEAESAAGVKITSTSPLTVRDNIFDHNDGSGFWCDLDCADATITRNVSRNNIGNGIFYEVSQRAIIASNVLTGNTEAGLSIGGADGVQIYNNTLYGNADTRPGELFGAELVVFDLQRPGCPPQTGCVERWRTRNVVIRNNLTGGAGSRRLFNSSTGVANLAARVPADTFITAMDHNGYHRPTAAGGPPTPPTFAGWLHPRPAAQGGPFHVDHASLASVQAFTATEDHGLAFDQAADPFFVDAAAGDFSLLASSPARASGDPLSAAVAAAIGVPTAPAPVDRGALAWPTLQLRVPAYGSTVGGPAVALATNVPDPARVTSVEYHVNRVGSMTATKVGSTVNRGFGYAVVWNTTAVADGSYELRAHAVRVEGTTRTVVKSPPILITVRNG